MARKTSTTLGRLIPNSIEVKSGDDSVIVAGNAEENKILNYFLAAKIRSLIEANLIKYKDSDLPMSPKELKDLADAGRSLAEFSATLYKENEPLAVRPKTVEQEDDAPDFDKLNPIEVDAKEQAIPEVK